MQSVITSTLFRFQQSVPSLADSRSRDIQGHSTGVIASRSAPAVINSACVRQASCHVCQLDIERSSTLVPLPNFPSSCFGGCPSSVRLSITAFCQDPGTLHPFVRPTQSNQHFCPDSGQHKCFFSQSYVQPCSRDFASAGNLP